MRQGGVGAPRADTLQPCRIQVRYMHACGPGGLVLHSVFGLTWMRWLAAPRTSFTAVGV